MGSPEEEDDLPVETAAPITYVTLAPEHLPQIHDLLRRTFWDGVNGTPLFRSRLPLLQLTSRNPVSDSLQYETERATIVAVYNRLVVGVALLSSPQETYITYLAVRSGWENAQIATSVVSYSCTTWSCEADLPYRTMLYLLISRNPNKDFTLHVSANNPAMVRPTLQPLIHTFQLTYPPAAPVQPLRVQSRRIRRRVLRRVLGP